MGNPRLMGAAVMPGGWAGDGGGGWRKKKGREMAEGFAGCEKGTGQIWEPLGLAFVGVDLDLGDMDSDMDLCVRDGDGMVTVSKLRIASSSAHPPPFCFNPSLSSRPYRTPSLPYLCMARITPPALFSLPRQTLRQCPPPPSLSPSNSSRHGQTGDQQSPRLPSPRRSPPSHKDAF